MTRSAKSIQTLLLILTMSASTAVAATAARETKKMTDSKESEVLRATGPFVVTMVPPDPAYDTVDEVALGRMTINKVFQGELDAKSVVHMLTAMTGVKGSAGYVAIERVTGTLHGRSGSFVLQHSGSMSAGEQQLSVMIVSDSGTGGLKGIAGRMTIDIAADGAHSYTLHYTLPRAAQ